MSDVDHTAEDYQPAPEPVADPPYDPPEPVAAPEPEPAPAPVPDPDRHHAALNAILGMLETLPAFAAMVGRVRAALNYVPPKE